ncbi:MAG: TIGR03936 family radical SAM-associated protein [Blautia sp.]
MKVRVKFAKEGVMKFIGHLDIMRYFQKAVKRAGLDAAFSEGFSPHMIMSFAAPLSVGITSTGEYFDMELKSASSSKEMVKALNHTMADGMRILSIRQVEEGKAGKAMSLVAAADYLVTFREGKEPEGDWKQRLAKFLEQPEIKIVKKTKKSEKEVDIRPFIYDMRLEGDSILMQLAAGSVKNTKPELVMEAFASYVGNSYDSGNFMIHRCEIYADTGSEVSPHLVSLEDLGDEIE